jgi:predicted lipase
MKGVLTMRYYNSPEDQLKDLNSRIESYRAAANLAPVIIKVLKQFDGKIFNCKLDKALREATGNNIGVFKQYGFISIAGHYTTNYHQITLATFKIEDLDNKRIDAEKIINQVITAREELLKKAYSVETYAEQADSIREYVRQSIDKLESICRALPDDIRDIYNIPYTIRTN